MARAWLLVEWLSEQEVKTVERGRRAARRRVELIMGMPIEIDVRDDDIDRSALDEAFDWLTWVDDTFSTYKAESQISRLNGEYLTISRCDPSVMEVLTACENLAKETDGYFDIRTDHLPCPLQTGEGGVTSDGVDPSGYVKGWAVDRAASILATRGSANFCINAGGDIRIKGGALPESRWRIGIRHPIEHDKVAAVVVSDNLAIATSGTYERGPHIIDPHTGAPPEGVLSVTITGPDLSKADAYATAAFAMGAEGPRWTMGLENYESMTIFEDYTVLFTPEFPREPQS